RPGERPGHIARYLNSGHVDGVIIASHHKDDRLEPELRSGSLPGVFVGRPFDSAGLHYVDVDNSAGARVATQRLVDRGCRTIAAVTGPQDMTASLDRHEGWRRTLSRAGLPTDAVANGDFTVEGGAKAMERLLADHPDIDGVFASS